MGQRHQAFIVARVVPHGSKDNKPFYRCIGAWHHQWCYGSLPLRAALRFIALVRNPVNAAIIREELKAIQGKYGRHREEPAIPDAPCPYSVFLLASAFNIALDETYTHGGPFGAGLLGAGMGCWDGDNNDGITILDITDPVNPSYAFAMDPGAKLLTARNYLGGYYAFDEEDDSNEEEGREEEGDREEEAEEQDREADEEEGEAEDREEEAEEEDREEEEVRQAKGNRQEDEQSREDRELVARFSSIAFLTEGMLAEAWPAEFSPNKKIGSTECTSEPSLTSTPQISDTVDTVPPLADLIVEPAVERSLEQGMTDEVELLVPGKSAQIKSALRARKPFPDAGVPLLVAVMEHELKKEPGILDLSGFSLSAEQLVSVVQSFDDVTILSLSNSHDLKIDHIRALLTAKPEIDRLNILDTSVTDETLTSLLTSEPKLFNRVSDIVHPLFLSGKPATNPGCFYVFADQSDNNIFYQSPPVYPAIPVWSPAKIVQNLVDVLQFLIASEGRMVPQLESMLIHTAMSAGLRKPGTPWRERPVTIFAQQLQQLHPNGWMFLLQRASVSMRIYGGGQRDRYAFARIVETKPGVQTYDLRGFLEEMKKEGRGPLPDTELVEQFEDLIIGGPNEKKKHPESYPTPVLPSALQSLFSGLSRGVTSSDTAPLFDNDAASKFVVSIFTKPRL